MKTLDLKYLQAFADVHQLEEQSFATVIFLSGVKEVSSSYKELFINQYEEVIKHGLLNEVKDEIKYGESGFFAACQEWDVQL